MNTMKKTVAVCGGRTCNQEIGAIAFKTGKLLAQAGFTLICGGLEGVMEAAARGAKEAQGCTIGVLPGIYKSEANNFIDIVIATGIGFARNYSIANSCDGMIAIGGAYGTLTEIAYALDSKKPVALLHSWHLHHPNLTSQHGKSFENPNDAVNWLKLVIT
jgi:uncharacterized protein (TIGR00725 family)